MTSNAPGIVLFAAAMFLPNAGGQRPTVTTAQFKAALVSVARNAPQWRKIVETVSLEQLPVSYRAGKQYENNKAIVTEDLKLVVLWAERMQHEESLFDEVNFLSAVQELQSQLQQFSGLLLDAEVRDSASQTKLLAWTSALDTLANGSINDLYQESLIYTTDHAMRADRICAQKGK